MMTSCILYVASLCMFVCSFFSYTLYLIMLNPLWAKKSTESHWAVRHQLFLLFQLNPYATIEKVLFLVFGFAKNWVSLISCTKDENF